MTNGIGVHEESADATDPFSLANLVVPQNYTEAVGTRKLHLAIPVRKPDKLWWVRVHPDPTFHARLFLLDDRENNETYLIANHLVDELEREVKQTYLFLAVNRSKTPFLWPATVPADKGRGNLWNDTGLSAAQTAMKQWVRVLSNRDAGMYEVVTTAMTLPEPEWPDGMSFTDLLRLAFGNRLINDWEHPFLKQLRGEV
jgi:hypothetical protein